MPQELTVREALEVAYETGQQVTIGLYSGASFEGAIVDALWETSFRLWLEPVESLDEGEDIDKAIVAEYAVKSVDFGQAD